MFGLKSKFLFLGLIGGMGILLIPAGNPPLSFMNNNRSWNILNWNIRGINSKDKWNAINQKIEESACVVVCIQETKREEFTTQYLRNFCPKRISKFAYLPSNGASGGILTAWNDSILEGELVFQNKLSLSVQFTNRLSNQFPG